MKVYFGLVAAALSLANLNLPAQPVSVDTVMQKVSKGKPYVLVLLYAGKPAPADKAVAENLHLNHLVSLFQMEKDGKISIFGPVTNESSPLRGIIVFNDPDVEKARKELEADPYIRDGYLKFEAYSWFSIPGQQLPR